jgi:hypothetical protein
MVMYGLRQSWKMSSSWAIMTILLVRATPHFVWVEEGGELFVGARECACD